MSICREWQGRRQAPSKGGSGGYGIRSIRGREVLVHRWVWEQAHGPIPAGMVVMHTCDNRACFLLDHLRLGTQGDNVRDASAKGRLRPGPGRPFNKGHDPRRKV